MEWSKIKIGQIGPGGNGILAVEGEENDLPLPDPEELDKRRQAQEKAFERMLANARELRRRLLALLDMLPNDDLPEENSTKGPQKDSPPEQEE
jgi:hypothetical protein